MGAEKKLKTDSSSRIPLCSKPLISKLVAEKLLLLLNYWVNSCHVFLFLIVPIHNLYFLILSPQLPTLPDFVEEKRNFQVEVPMKKQKQKKKRNRNIY